MQEYLKLNNEMLNTYEKTGIIDKEKDIEATDRFFKDYVNC